MKLDRQTTAGLTLPAGKKDVIYFDEALAGFGLRIREGGARSWVAQYRSKGRSRRVNLGAFDKLTADQARKLASKHMAEVLMGGDPSQRKAEERKREALSVLSVAKAYIDAKRDALRPRSIQELERYLLDSTYFGPLHSSGAGTVTRADVAACITRISKRKGHVTAAHARASLSAMFTWSMGEGFIGGSNPVVGTNHPGNAKPRERVLSNEELAAVWNGVDGNSDYGRSVRLLILLGSRRSEVAGMRWDEIDLDAGTWTLPAERSKNHREHTLPLPKMALDILRSIHRRVGRDHVFGDHSDKGFTAWHVSRIELDKRLKLSEPWHHHDIRRSVVTGMCDIGVMPHVVEQVVNHVSGHKGGVAGIYNRSSYEREVRNALEMWADHVRAFVSGKGRKVLAFPTVSGG
jgi:integrase